MSKSTDTNLVKQAMVGFMITTGLLMIDRKFDKRFEKDVSFDTDTNICQLMLIFPDIPDQPGIGLRVDIVDYKLYYDVAFFTSGTDLPVTMQFHLLSRDGNKTVMLDDIVSCFRLILSKADEVLFGVKMDTKIIHREIIG